MESLLLDETGDLVMVDGDLQLTRDMDEVEQLLRTLLQTNKNEWFLNENEGFDYSVVNGVKQIDEDALYIALNDVAEQIDEIESIEDVEVEFNRRTRQAHIKAVAYLVNGESFEFEEVF